LTQTCREAVLAAFDRLESQHRRKDFDLSEIVQEVLNGTGNFAESTIRTHVTSKMCVQAPTNHAMKYADLDRIGVGRYRRQRWATS
jgi:hypothetical protein